MVEDRYQKGVPARAKQPDMKKILTQEEQAQTRFRPSPYQPPCPVPPPAGAPPGVEPDHTELIQRILEQNETFRQILVQLTEIAKSPGIAPELENEYYNTPLTGIQAATANPPAGDNLDPTKITRILLEATWTASTAYILGNKVRPTSANSTGYLYECTTVAGGTSGGTEPVWPTSLCPPPPPCTIGDNTVTWECIPADGYQVEGIYTQLQRISPRVTVINDGTSTIYAITTFDGSNWSQESPILTGEARTLFNVWELRLRSPTAGNLTLGTGGIYRVTEYDFWLAYSSLVNKATLDARVVNAPVLGALLSTQLGGRIDVPNGYALALRATVGNAGQVYIGNSIANAINAAIPGNRITLNAGDSARLYIKNTDSVAIAGSVALQNLDILVEQ